MSREKPLICETGAICEEISQHMLEADHYRDAIAASKGEKFCPACHKAVMREASFVRIVERRVLQRSWERKPPM